MSAACTEHRADQRPDRGDVVACVRRDEAALALEVRIDAADIRVDIRNQLPSLLGLLRERGLSCKERLRLRTRDELAGGQRDREGGVPRNVVPGPAFWPAEQFSITAAVLFCPHPGAPPPVC